MLLDSAAGQLTALPPWPAWQPWVIYESSKMDAVWAITESDTVIMARLAAAAAAPGERFDGAFGVQAVDPRLQVGP